MVEPDGLGEVAWSGKYGLESCTDGLKKKKDLAGLLFAGLDATGLLSTGLDVTRPHREAHLISYRHYDH